MPVISVICWCIHYTVFAILSGVIGMRIMIGNKTDETVEDICFEKRIAIFAAFSCLGPFIIAIQQWLALSVLGRAGLVATVGGGVIATLACLYFFKGELQGLIKEGLSWVRSSHWRIAASVLIGCISVWMFVWIARYSTLPLYDTDGALYGQNASLIANGPLAGYSPMYNPHGLSYELFLSSSYAYDGSFSKDLAGRFGARMCALHLYLAIVGLALSMGAATATLASVLILLYAPWGQFLYAASRDFFRLLPMITLLGLFVNTLKSPRSWSYHLYVAVALGCLWNAHRSSVVIVPVLTLIIILVERSWRDRGFVAIICVLSFMACASANMREEAFKLAGRIFPKEIKVTTATSAPFSPASQGSNLTPATMNWSEYTNKKLGWLAPGIGNAREKATKQLDEDGTLLVIASWIGLCLFPVFGIYSRRSRGSKSQDLMIPSILFLFMFISQLQIIGAQDRLYSISPFLCWSRYRLSFYLGGVLLAAWILQGLVQRLVKHSTRSQWTLSAVVLLTIVAASPATLWKKKIVSNTRNVWSLPMLWDRDGCRLFLQDEDKYYGWMKVLSRIPAEQQLLLEQEQVGKYYLGDRIRICQYEYWAMPPADLAKRLYQEKAWGLVMLQSTRTALNEVSPLLSQALSTPFFEKIDAQKEEWGWVLYQVKPDGVVRAE